MQHAQKSPSGSIPFDHHRLDALMAAYGLDALLVCSRHNLKYLLGGYSFFFFDRFEAFGVSRHFPVLLYFQGRPDDTIYIGNGMEGFVRGKLWVGEAHTKTWAINDAMKIALARLAEQPGLTTLGVEPHFLPMVAADMLAALPGVRVVDGQRPLELLRAIKTPEHLAHVKKASDDVVDAMLAVMKTHGVGNTKAEFVAALAREEEARGLGFEYCLITAGTSLNRAPDVTVVREGDIMSIDSGGQYNGYIGDLCRMAIAGDPDQELVDLLAEIDAIQTAARAQIAEGAPGHLIYDAALRQIAASPNAALVDFTAHGVGTVTHETPRLDPHGVFAYEPTDASQPQQQGMVFSVETAIKHPRRGFIKLEDTIALTAAGPVAYGDYGRGWNRLA